MNSDNPMDLKSYLSERRIKIETALKQYVEGYCSSPHLIEAIQYALMAGGKRLRPILCLAASAVVGGDVNKALPAACSLEMIHTYSLIHDDLPAMDNDDLRRGQPTCHIKFNEATAILCGDALLNMAFEILSQSGLKAPVSQSHIWLKVTDTIAKASGCKGMIGGQASDIANEGVSMGIDDLQTMHKLKTGALIRASVCSGALLGGGSEQQIDHLDEFAKNIGLAFQVVDDILNVIGDPDKLGKAVGTDSQRQKNTYPALMGLEASKEFADTLIDSALQALSIFDNKADPLRVLARYIIERNR